MVVYKVETGRAGGVSMSWGGNIEREPLYGVWSTPDVRKEIKMAECQIDA